MAEKATQFTWSEYFLPIPQSSSLPQLFTMESSLSYDMIDFITKPTAKFFSPIRSNTNERNKHFF